MLEYSLLVFFLLQAFERASGCVCRRPNDFLGAVGELSIEKQKKHHPFLFLVFYMRLLFIKMKVVVFFSVLIFFFYINSKYNYVL